MPWHPALVHFPIALATMAAIFQLLAVVLDQKRFTGSALIALGIGALMALTSAITGTAQEEAAQALPRIHDALERHEQLGTLGTALFGALAIGGFYLHMKERLKPRLFLVALILLAVMMILAGYFGGVLVYEYGAGGS